MVEENNPSLAAKVPPCRVNTLDTLIRSRRPWLLFNLDKDRQRILWIFPPFSGHKASVTCLYFLWFSLSLISSRWPRAGEVLCRMVENVVSGKDISPSFGKTNSAFSLSMSSRGTHIRQLLSHRLRGIGKLKERCRLTLTDRVTSFSVCGALLSVWKIISRRLIFLAFRQHLGWRETLLIQDGRPR